LKFFWMARVCFMSFFLLAAAETYLFSFPCRRALLPFRQGPPLLHFCPASPTECSGPFPAFFCVRFPLCLGFGFVSLFALSCSCFPHPPWHVSTLSGLLWARIFIPSPVLTEFSWSRALTPKPTLHGLIADFPRAVAMCVTVLPVFFFHFFPRKHYFPFPRFPPVRFFLPHA